LILSSFPDARSVSQAKQRSNAPGRGDAEPGDERHANEMIRRCAFAPALEHGNDSADEQYDCGRAKKLQQHDRTPLRAAKITRPGTVSIVLQRVSRRSDARHE